MCESTRLEGLSAFEWKVLVKFRATIAENGKVRGWIDPEEDTLNDAVDKETAEKTKGKHEKKGDDHGSAQKGKDAV